MLCVAVVIGSCTDECKGDQSLLRNYCVFPWWYDSAVSVTNLKEEYRSELRNNEPMHSSAAMPGVIVALFFYLAFPGGCSRQGEPEGARGNAHPHCQRKGAEVQG